MSLKQSLMLSVVFEKSIKIYDLYSFCAKCSAIVDFPTRLAPSSKTAYFSDYLSFQSNNFLYTFLSKYITYLLSLTILNHEICISSRLFFLILCFSSRLFILILFLFSKLCAKIRYFLCNNIILYYSSGIYQYE